MDAFLTAVRTVFTWGSSFWVLMRDTFPLNMFLALFIIGLPILLVLRARDGR